MSAHPTESVWDYPRPPRIEPADHHITVELGGRRIADARGCVRVLETSHPPTYYLPLTAFAPDALRPARGRSLCEWKGQAAYFDVVSGEQVVDAAAWTYPRPTPLAQILLGYVSLYPGRMDRCLVDGDEVRAQPGDFYGGWITSWITGPFKGDPGTMGW